MKKGLTAAIVIVAVLIVAGGAYAMVHKTNHKPASTTSTKNSAPNIPAVNNAIVVTKTDTALGQYLATPDGKPLYIYNADSVDTSKCTGSCLSDWPAYQDTGATASLPAGMGTIKRTDNGQTQFTYNGMPLYTFTGDQGGRPTGNGAEDFSLAKPAAASSSHSSSHPANASGASSAYGASDSW